MTCSLIWLNFNAQTGIGTISPAATLDVVGKPSDSSALDGVIAPRLTGNELKLKNYTNAQTGAIVYITAADSSPSGQTVNVTASGYYYFDGSVWRSIGSSNTFFIPKIVTSASYGSASPIVVSNNIPAFVVPTNVANLNDGNYDLGTDKYTVTNLGTYQLSITVGYTLAGSSSSSNSVTLLAVKATAGGTPLQQIILGTVANFSYAGANSGLVSLSGSAIIRANPGEKLYFLVQVCGGNGCVASGTYSFSQVEATYQQISQ